jgi:hypothetical protein
MSAERINPAISAVRKASGAAIVTASVDLPEGERA